MAHSDSGDSIVDRVVRIFEAFDTDAPALTLSEVAVRSDLPVSTASRLVEQLISHGLLRRDNKRRIRVAVRMWELASRASPSLALRQIAMPFMEDLQAVVEQHTQLGVRDGKEVLFLERLSARKAVVNITKIAGRLPLHASSGGLVLLAHASNALQDEVLAARLRAYNDNTVTEPAQLRRLLAEVRSQGFALCPGFIDPLATGIAVPVRNSRNRVMAALAVVVPNEPGARGYVGAVQTAARGLERALRAPAPILSTEADTDDEVALEADRAVMASSISTG